MRLWIKKADNDLKVAKGEINTEDPATDVVCFHAQQCVEKYLKAYLVFRGKQAPKTHDISKIAIECITLDPEFQSIIEKGIDEITSYAVELRYPDEAYFPSKEESLGAISSAEYVKMLVLRKFDL